MLTLSISPENSKRGILVSIRNADNMKCSKKMKRRKQGLDYKNAPLGISSDLNQRL